MFQAVVLIQNNSGSACGNSEHKPVRESWPGTGKRHQPTGHITELITIFMRANYLDERNRNCWWHLWQAAKDIFGAAVDDNWVCRWFQGLFLWWLILMYTWSYWLILMSDPDAWSWCLIMMIDPDDWIWWHYDMMAWFQVVSRVVPVMDWIRRHIDHHDHVCFKNQAED